MYKIFIIFLLLTCSLAMHGEKPAKTDCLGCTLTGPTSVNQLDVVTYTMSAGCSTPATSWDVSCGSIMSSTSTSVTVYFNQINCSSSIITALNGSSAIIGKTVTISVPPPLNGGTISNPSQTVAYNIAQGSVNASGESGGSCSGFTYQWWYSTDGNTWNVVANSNVANYPLPALTHTTSYKRLVLCGTQTAYTTNIATVTVMPPLTAGTIAGPSGIASYNSSVTLNNTQGAGGGNCGGSYTYQWWISYDGINYQQVTGASGPSYTLNLNVTVWIIRKVLCGPESVNSNTVQVQVRPDLNYIRTRDLQRPGITDAAGAALLTDPHDVSQVTQYYDGLGRPVQNVAKQASPTLHDMVSMNVYDVYDREPQKYLPYSSVTTDGNYKFDASTEQQSFNAAQFPDEHTFYAQTNFEPSPLNRVSLAEAPGDSWAGAGRGITSGYQVNVAADSVHIWNIAPAPGSLPVDGGLYAPGSLYKNATLDEQQHQQIEFRDLQGRIVLKKIQQTATASAGHTGWLCTYTVYDDLDNMRFVIPPLGLARLRTSGWVITQAVADGLCYRYEYDDRRHMIIKKLPGAGETWMVYDARDRVVMSQDSVGRYKGFWLVKAYDGLNRQDSTGKLVNANNRAYHQNLAGGSTSYPSTAGNSAYTLYTKTYYDDYSWVPVPQTTLLFASQYTGNANYFVTSLNTSPQYAQPIVASGFARGLITGVENDVLGYNNWYLNKLNFYDDRGRLIQTISSNYQTGVDTTTTQYDFSGRMIRGMVSKNDPIGMQTRNIAATKTNYDAAGRRTSSYMRLDNATTYQLVDSIKYNELGQLRVKYLGNFLDSLVYDYNIRGWIAAINKKYIAGTPVNYFGQEVSYDKGTSVAPGNSYVTPQYNGNIAGVTWKSAGDGINRKYDLTYDLMNRLVDASFKQNTSGTGWDIAKIDYSTHSVAYDLNGNILTMNQMGFKITGSSLIDQLQYSYTVGTNQLASVTDFANDASSKLGDLHYPGGVIKSGADYTYDGNGSITSDRNKGITKITYNYLGLPDTVSMTGKGYIVYTYSGDGVKMRKIIVDSLCRHQTWTSYSDGFVYSHNDSLTPTHNFIDTLQYVSHDEGRARWALHKYTNGTSAFGWEYDFFEKDHLNNTRVILTQQKDTSKYIATMEAAYRAKELALFYNVDSTSYPVSAVPGGYPADNTTTPNDSVARVNGTAHRMGPALLLKVMSGDTVTVGVRSFYRSGGSVGTPNNSLPNVLSSLAQGLVGITSGTKGAIGDLNNSTTSPVFTALNSFMPANDSNTSSRPKAYLNWMLMDNQLAYVGGNNQSGAIPVGNPDVLNTLGTTIPLQHSGYLYIWVSNETPAWDAFFDNLCVQMVSGPMVEETHYYPFGLTMAAISDKALKGGYVENKYKFNSGSQLQSKEFIDGSGLELYDVLHRMYDPQIGRFAQIDPLGDINVGQSTYGFGSNNPLSHVDPFGLTDTVVTTRGTDLKPVYVIGHAHARWIYLPSSTKDDRRIWQRNQGIFWDRVHRGQNVNQPGDPSSYTESVPMYLQWKKAEEESRTMQKWAVGIIAAPALAAASPAELMLAFRVARGMHYAAFGVDFGVQAFVNAKQGKNIFTNYNFVSGGIALGLGVPEGAPLINVIGANALFATAGTTFNLSYNSVFKDDKISTGIHPLSILIGAGFNTLAWKFGDMAGGHEFGDGSAAPVNFAGAAVDEATKPEEKKEP